ncbi:MAG: hypothetical protein JSU87_09615 [Gemmatimonadota bacterium]|nr:MAG: hypothetical protein JSU87_09615 [Gemmatimonadota bacterium]
MITRAIFVLSSPEAAEQFLKVVPDLRAGGLSEATILHIVSAKRGPAEPMPDLANWVRHFEAAVPRVELALKRGDAVKWIYELARVRDADVVVLSGIRNGAEWDFESVSSPLRRLGIPILFLPDQEYAGALGDHVLLAVKSLDSFQEAVPGLQGWLGQSGIRAIRICRPRELVSAAECAGVSLEVLRKEGDVAGIILQQAKEWGATLLTILAKADPDSEAGDPVVKPLLEGALWPVLIWPAQGKTQLTR